MFGEAVAAGRERIGSGACIWSPQQKTSDSKKLCEILVEEHWELGI